MSYIEKEIGERLIERIYITTETPSAILALLFLAISLGLISPKIKINIVIIAVAKATEEPLFPK